MSKAEREKDLRAVLIDDEVLRDPIFGHLGVVIELLQAEVRKEQPNASLVEQLTAVSSVFSAQLKNRHPELDGGHKFDHPLGPQWVRMTELLGEAINMCGLENAAPLVTKWVVECGPMAELIDRDLSQFEGYRRTRQSIDLRLPQTPQALAFRIAFNS